MKYCPECREDKPLTDFYHTEKRGASSYCKPCYSKNQRAWYHARKAARSESKRKIHLRNRYGLSEEEQAALPTSCQICGSEEKLHVDHDHETGAYRGVLCARHNLGIRYFFDDPMLLRAAANYLDLAQMRR